MDSAPAGGGIMDTTARALALAGGLVMLAAGLLVTTSVVLRAVRNDGVQGDFELVQMATAVAIFCFLPLCQMQRGNVFVDTFTLKAPTWFNRGLDVLWDVVFAGFALVIAWRLALGAFDAFASRTGTMVLGLPIGYGIAATALMALLLAGVAVHTAVRLARTGR